jgi:hypothetical protein
MRSRAAALAAVATLAGAIVVLFFPEGDDRVWWFRGYVVLVGVLATRALVTWVDAQPRPPSPPPFRRRRRWPRRAVAEVTRPTARLIHLATFSAGDAHRGLRPALQEVADERLRAHHGIGLDGPAAATRLAPATWELLRPDRPRPHDLRAPGLTLDAIDRIIDDLEQL